MIFSETVSYWLMEYCSIHSWQDALEILFFASAIYAASSWLKQDKNNRLLIGFYSYIALFCATYFFDLPTLQNSLLFAAPIIGTLSIIYHQKQLQKNFILARRAPIHQGKVAAPNWIESCIRSCLMIAHEKHEITCIIEQNDILDSMIDRSLLINVHMQKDILNLLLMSDAFHPEQPILLKKNGNITSVNCSWGESLTETLFSTNDKQPNGKHMEHSSHKKLMQYCSILIVIQQKVVFAIKAKS